MPRSDGCYNTPPSILFLLPGPFLALEYSLTLLSWLGKLWICTAQLEGRSSLLKSPFLKSLPRLLQPPSPQGRQEGGRLDLLHVINISAAALG